MCFNELLNEKKKHDYAKLLWNMPYKITSLQRSETFTPRCSVKKVFIQNSQENTSVSLFFNKAAGQAYNFMKKETLAQVSSLEFYEICKSPFYRTPPVATSKRLSKIPNESLVYSNLIFCWQHSL